MKDEDGDIVPLPLARLACDKLIKFINDEKMDPMVAYVGVTLLKKQLEQQYGIQSLQLFKSPEESELN